MSQRAGNVPGTGNKLGSQQEAREPARSPESAMSQGVSKVNDSEAAGTQ